jgi:protoporphyrinogen/coproporphyrinogen III oxidase
MDSQHKVIVIGAGITGLTVAHHLHRSGIDVAVLEKTDHAGGTMTTLRKDGWVIERGPNSGLETTPLLGELFDELNLREKVAYANDESEKRYILRNGRLHAIPTSPVSFLTTKLWSVSGKLRIFLEPFIGRANKEESISGFVTRRLGRELLDYAINPFVAGVYAGDPSKLSVQAAFPKLYALEDKYGGLIRGMILGARERKKRAEKAKDRSRQFSFTGGMQVLPDAIAAELGSKIFYKSEIRSIQKNAGNNEQGYLINTLTDGVERNFNAGIIVFAIPSYAVAEWIGSFDKSLSVKLSDIYYPPVAEVFLGYKKESIGQKPDGFGFLVPEIENRTILGTIWSSTIFSGRAPEGFAGLTTFVGGSRQPELAKLPDKELLDTVHMELKKIMKINGDPSLSFINRWERAIPQYQIGHGEIIKEIENFEQNNRGFILGGNYRGGISVSDCIISAKRISGQVKSLLKQETSQNN